MKLRCVADIYTTESKRKRLPFCIYIYIKEARTTKISNPGLKQTVYLGEYSCFEARIIIMNHVNQQNLKLCQFVEGEMRYAMKRKRTELAFITFGMT